MKKNDKDEAQLWIGFLDYYAQKFQYKTDVVTIRMGRTLSKFEKLWNSDTLAIEDPFDLKRNLGSALSKKSEYLWLIIAPYSSSNKILRLRADTGLCHLTVNLA